MKTSSRILHEGDNRSAHQGAVNPPIYHTSLFTFPSMQAFLDRKDGASARHTYTRESNPTIQALEQKIAMLEDAEGCIVTASGMGAITAAILATVQTGDHALVVDSCYGPTREFMDEVMAGLGVETSYYHPDLDDLSELLRPNTRLVYLESPGSQSFHIQDLVRLSKQARMHGAVTVADNSWATPLHQQPHRLGVDIVVHSGTKYIAGHSDVVAGLITVGSNSEGGELLQRVRQVAILLGATLGPAETFLVQRGLRTLPIRMAQLQKNGLTVARWLQSHPKVRRVLHPGLPDFPGHELAQKQMSGWSSLFSVELRQPADSDQRHRFVDHLRLFSIGVSWGGYESLIIPLLASTPAIAAQHERVGLNDDCYRLSIGLEDADDLIADLEQGLAAYGVASSRA
jgi:cystathionine beta-lyase